MPHYLTRESAPQVLDDYKMEGLTGLDHWSSPNGCHDDCPACAAELEFNPHVAWKLDVGAECNQLLELAADLERNRVVLLQGEHVWPVPAGYKPIVVPKASAVAAILRSLVERVANAEELETE